METPVKLTWFLAPPVLLASLAQALGARQLDTPDGRLPLAPAAAFGAEATPAGAQAENGFLHADFDAQGVHLVAARAQANAPAARLSLELLAVERGGVPAALAAPSISVSGARVVLDRGAVAELYTIGERDLEQAASIQEPPGPAGDLVLRYRLSTELSGERAEPARHGPLELGDAFGPALHYGTAYAFDARARSVGVLTRYDGAETLELVVPAEFVDEARFPLLVDPAIGFPFLVDPLNPAFQDGAPDVAQSKGVFMVVWQRTIAAGDTRVRAARYDLLGSPLGGLIFVDAAASLSVGPRVGATQGLDEFLVAWSDSTTGGASYSIRARHVDGDDGSMAAEFTVAAAGIGEKLSGPDVGGDPLGNGAGFLVAWTRQLAGETAARELWYSLVTANPGFFYIAPTLVQAVPAGQHVAEAAVCENALALPDGYLAWRLAWSRFYPTPPPGDHDVHTACIRTKGSVEAPAYLDSPGVLAGADGIGPDERWPSLALFGSTFYGLWNEDGETHARLLDTAGELGVESSLHTAGTTSYETCVAPCKCDLVAGYLRQGVGEFNLDAFGGHLMSSGQPGNMNNLLEDPGDVYQSGIRVASRASDDRALFVWHTQAPVTGNNDVHAILFRPVTAGDLEMGAGCPGPGGLTPLLSDIVDPISGSNEPDLGLFYSVQVTQAPPGAPLVLVLGAQGVDLPIPGAPGCTQLTVPILAWGGVTDAAGTWTKQLFVPCDPSLDDDSFYLQAAVLVPGFNPAGLIATRALWIYWFD